MIFREMMQLVCLGFFLGPYSVVRRYATLSAVISICSVVIYRNAKNLWIVLFLFRLHSFYITLF